MFQKLIVLRKKRGCLLDALEFERILQSCEQEHQRRFGCSEFVVMRYCFILERCLVGNLSLLNLSMVLIKVGLAPEFKVSHNYKVFQI